MRIKSTSTPRSLAFVHPFRFLAFIPTEFLFTCFRAFHSCAIYLLACTPSKFLFIFFCESLLGPWFFACLHSFGFLFTFFNASRGPCSFLSFIHLEFFSTCFRGFPQSSCFFAFLHPIRVPIYLFPCITSKFPFFYPYTSHANRHLCVNFQT